MTIKGLGNGGISSPDPRRTDSVIIGKRAGVLGAAEAGRPTLRVDSNANSDVVELSPDALRGLAGAGVPPRGTLPLDRVKEIAARIADGSYDRPEVQDVVLDRLASQLETLGDTPK